MFKKIYLVPALILFGIYVLGGVMIMPHSLITKIIIFVVSVPIILEVIPLIENLIIIVHLMGFREDI